MSHRPLLRLALFLAFVLTPVAFAQPLADRLPDDALIYVGWRGTENPGPAFAQSRFKAFLDESAIPQLFNEVLPKALDKMAEKDRGAALFREVLAKVGPSLWKYPTALYVGPVDGLAVGQPMPRIALLCQAGAGAAQLKTDINAYLDQIPPGMPIPVVAVEENGIVAVTVGNVTPDLSGKSKTTLPNRREFIEAMAQVGKDTMLAMYVDVEGVTALIDNAIGNAPRDAAAKWQMVEETLGLGGLKRIAWTAGFDGRDWATQGFVMAPAPRKGLLQLIDAGPLSDDALKSVPQSATMMIAGKLDFAALLAAVRGAVGKLDPAAPDRINSGLAMINIALGINLETDLFQPLGDEWVAYTAPSVGGVGPLGFVLVNHARDAAKLQSALFALETRANGAINGQTNPGQPRGNFVQTKVGDLTIHYLNTPFLSPAWAVKNGNLYVGLFPQVIASAANAASGKSILDNEDFVAVRKRVGGEKASSLSYFDLPKSAPVGYPYLLAATRVLGFADMFGVQTPAMVLPPIDKITPLLLPAGSATWTDDTGVHMKSISPFPCATMLGGPEMILMEGATAVGFLLPAYAKTRAEASRPAQPATPK